jgi:uncharacterized protein (DUF1800 family)
MANLSPMSSLSTEQVQHLARRAGFGLSPEAAAALAGQDAATVVAAWVDGTGLDAAGAAFDQALANADPVDQPGRGSSPHVAAAVPGPHRYLVDEADAWRNELGRAQAYLAFRMQYAPYAMRERMALFWHNLFATGHQKVNSVALMLQHYDTLRTRGLDRFEELHAAVSKDPAMCLWLDSVLNRADGDNVPNENYAREAMELYSLGADNNYNQGDITQLARALSGWSFTVAAADLVRDPTSQDRLVAKRGTFRVFDGSSIGGQVLWDDLAPGTAPTRLPNHHGTGPVTFLGRTFADIATPATGLVAGEDVLRSITTSRAQEASLFLARRLVLHFVTGNPVPADVADVAARLRAVAFDVRAVMKELLASQWFHAEENRFALVEGPVSWTVRAARALGYDLASANAATAAANRFPAWAEVCDTSGDNAFDLSGMRLLDPAGPNGWKEDLVWLNSNSMRYRTRLAAALALGETFRQDSGVDRALFPTDPSRWFTSPPGSPQAVLAGLLARLQPAPIPSTVQDGWLTALWPSSFDWASDTTKQKTRELAFLILCSPSAQVY